MFGFGDPDNGVATDRNWRKLEREGENSRHFEGYDLQTQKHSSSTGKRPDYFGINPDDNHDRIVGDAKCVTELTFAHVEQVIGYKGHPFFAKKGVLIVAADTLVSHDVRSYAREYNIAIERTSVSLEKGFFDRLLD